MKINCAYQELLALDDPSIIPNPDNPNDHSEDQIERLAKIIDYQGQRSPIVISNLSGFITKGHGRLMAIKKLGWEKIAVDYQDYENKAQEYADIVSDNAIAEWSTLDLSKINDEALKLEELDIDMLGIKDFEVTVPETLEPGCDEDEAPEPPDEPATKRGDVWLLGDHRLMCGDSTLVDDIGKLMNGNNVDMVFTDPPYNVGFNGRSGKHEVIKGDAQSDQDFTAFIIEICQNIQALKPKAYYVWCNWKFYGLLQGLLDFKTCIVWAKNVFGMGKGYRHQHEFCLFNGEIEESVKNESDLWNVKKDTNYVHPTQKPVALSVRAFGNHVKLLHVLDLFGGSGSTLIGAEQTRRIAYIMELDEKYCDVIINRWQKYTGKEATLESTGKTYNQLKEARSGEK